MTAPFHLEHDVFSPVALRISQRAESLREIRKFQGAGIEAWLKVEAVAALGSRIKKVQNRGPDLIFTDDSRVELKAGCGLDVAYIRRGINKYRVPCIFLGYGDPARLSTKRIEMVKSHTFSDGTANWVVGLLRLKATDLNGEQSAAAYWLPPAAEP